MNTLRHNLYPQAIFCDVLAEMPALPIYRKVLKIFCKITFEIAKLKSRKPVENSVCIQAKQICITSKTIGNNKIGLNYCYI